MNRTDRLLAIVLELQNKGRQRAEDLAATFETSKRTIYRDIQALSESGVPLVAVPGQGYQLMEGYFLPPINFTTAEATMLLLGSDFVADNFDLEYQSAAQSASRKIESVLPPALREEVHEMQGSVRFISSPGGNVETVKLLRRAIVERKTVRFRYFARQRTENSSSESKREVDPYGLVYFNRAWYLSAYCHLRRDRRNFRLDRIENFSLTDKTFQRPPNFKLEQTDEERIGFITAQVLFDREVARWAKESQNFYVTSTEEVPAGLLVTLRARQENDLVDLVLRWGHYAQVLEPDSLRQRVCAEAEAILKIYQKGESLLT